MTTFLNVKFELPRMRTCIYKFQIKAMKPARLFSSFIRSCSLRSWAKMSSSSDESIFVAIAELDAFIQRCMVAVGTKITHAKCLSDTLISADYRGHYTHGINRLEMYADDIKSKTCCSDKEPEIEKESVSTALVNGHNLLGPVVGNFCMDLAIEKAKKTGIAWVVAHGSNHFGIAGWYTLRAVKQGLLGLACTNSSPFMVPTRAKQKMLGTNPISVAAPAQGADSFVLDMATTAVAVGKVEVQNRKGEPIPEGWILEPKYKENSNEVDVSSILLYPLGGKEQNSGYKGYGLGMMVEVFCGILSGAKYANKIRNWLDHEGEADLGQCFMAMDPSFFQPGFEGRMSDLMEMCRNLEPENPDKPVLVPGDPERAHMALCDARNGIPYHANFIKATNALAAKLGVDPIAILA